jgi:RimJ/RimL family protein N-acetyltransferase/NTP pyrophosphatase (non-canonical NTP hydrolase)
MESFPVLRAQAGSVMLRPFEATDVPAVAAACNDEQTQRWLRLPRPYTHADAVSWCTRLSHELRERGDGLALAMTTATGEFVGAIDLEKTDWRAKVTEIGYWTAPHMRSAGHATAAAGYLARWALDAGMERVELTAATGNRASQRVAEKAGFEFEGIMRNAGVTHAGRVDQCLYALTRDHHQAGNVGPVATHSVQDMVAEFHAKFGTAAAGAQRTSAVRRAFLAEEYQEYESAEDAGDRVEIADALADIVYVVYGTALSYEIDLNAVLAEVHASNMTKDAPLEPGGKAVKGPGYRPPDIAGILGGTPRSRR